MSKLVLTACPYCLDKAGIIAVDANHIAHTEEIVKDSESLNLAERTDQQLIMLRAEQPAAPPCEHLILLDGYCAVLSEKRACSRPWPLYFFWHHPLLRELEKENRALAYMWHVYDYQDAGVQISKQCLPSMPFCWTEFERSDYPTLGHGRDVKLSAHGFVLFACDVDRFFAEASELALQPLPD